MDFLFDLLGLVFSREAAGPVIAAALVAIAVGRWYFAWRESKGFLTAADRRIAALKQALGTDEDPDASRVHFAENFETARTALVASDHIPLQHAWHEFAESIVSERETPLRNTARPSGFFHRVIPKQKALVFWSNAFVGIGLIFTFLGVVYALHTAAQGMQGASVQASQGALQGLLTAASAKFFSSIGGLGASLMLRFAESNLQKKLDARGYEICDLLERAMAYVPPQRLAVEQLDELKRQSTQLEKFNTDLAMAIGEQFEKAMQPVHISIDNLNKSFSSGASAAIDKAASGELRALGETLGQLQTQMSNLPQQMQGSGEDAARQIRAAGADFAEAAEKIREAFGNLTGEVASIGQSMTADAETARKHHVELMETTRAAHEATSAQAAETVSRAVEALQGAGRHVAAELQTQMGEAMTAAAKEAEGVVRTAISESGRSFAEAGQSISDAVGTAANRISALSEAIGQSERRAAGTAEALLSTADGARAAAEAMNQAAGGFEAAAAPVAGSAKSLQDASARIAERLDASERATQSALMAMRELVEEMNETQSAATGAWDDYKARFSGVDQSLEKVLGQITETLEGSMKEFQRYSLEVDKNMGLAVSRLNTVIEPLTENSQAIVDFTEALTSSERVAAE